MTVNENDRLRRLGGTNLMVTPIGLGVMQFSGSDDFFGMMFPKLSQDEKNAIIKAALDGGINWFDTAEMYGLGRSERSLSDALKAAGKKDDEVVIVTKWFPIFRTARNISRTIADRIRYLDGYTIDLYLVHQPWGFSSPEAEMDAMADLVAAGKIRAVGVSNFSAAQMERAQVALQKRGLALAVNQVQYSLLNRKIETNGILEAARDLNVTVVAWGPLGSGLLTGKFHQNPALLDAKPAFRRFRFRRNLEPSLPVIQALEKLAARYDSTPAQVALNWLVHFQGETVVAIPGASAVHHAVESARALAFKLTPDEMAQLDEVSRDFR